MTCILKLNATVWRQKLNTEALIAKTSAQNGTEKDSKKGLKIKSSRQMKLEMTW